MKIGCDACEKAEAAVLCCADEAALCRHCDAAVHSANRLAGKHHRVALLLPTAVAADADDVHPTCDICQEKTGYFFCLEDRALLCPTCDVAVHTATPHVAAHRRFLITGVRIGGSVDATACAAADVIVSPRASSSIAPAGSASNHAVAAGNGRSPSPVVRFADEGDGIELEQRWSWSDVFADDDDGSAAMEQCYAGFSEPHSSSLTG